MALKGSAFLALWNDFDPRRDEEYNRWHTFEHVPERVGIDGVLSGRRYLARERGDRRYFTLYELTDLAALDGASYLEVVEHPTEWTLSMRASFRNFLRRPCATEFSVGQGHGAVLGTYCFCLSQAADPGIWEPVLGSLVAKAAAVAIHVGRVDLAAKFPLQNASAAMAGIPYVMLVEVADRAQLEAAASAAVLAVVDALKITSPVEGEVYDLAFVVQKRDLADATTSRQRPRPDLI